MLESDMCDHAQNLWAREGLLHRWPLAIPLKCLTLTVHCRGIRNLILKGGHVVVLASVSRSVSTKPLTEGCRFSSYDLFVVYHGPSISAEEERRLKILRTLCQVLFWGCIVIALLLAFSLTLPVVLTLSVLGVLGLWGEIKIGGRLRHHRNEKKKERPAH